MAMVAISRGTTRRRAKIRSRKMRSVVNGFVVAIIVAIMVACGNTGRTVVVEDIESRVWSEPRDFFYDNSDTLALRDISIVVRYEGSRVADSVAMDILTISPDSLVYEEPFTLHIPRLADMRPDEHTFIYRRNVLLARPGRYLFRLTPHAPAEGIASMGIVVGGNAQTDN